MSGHWLVGGVRSFCDPFFFFDHFLSLNSLAAVYELPDLPTGVEGLLGMSFLSQFEVTVDAARNQLHLRRPRR